MRSYSDWIRATLVAREHSLSDPERVKLWLELAHELRAGRSVVFGAQIPAEQLPVVQRELLPELDARVESLANESAIARERSGVALWPVRTRAAEKALRAEVASLARVKHWFAYPRVATFEAGDLLAVGFAPATERLLVVSAHGLAVLDADEGLLAHDDADRPLPGYPDWADGIGPIERARVALMGLDGGTPLARRTPDGWTLGVLDPEREARVWLSPPDEHAEHPGARSRRLATSFRALIAAGFSDSGETLVIAEPDAVHLFRRP